MVVTPRGFWNSVIFPSLFSDKCKISLTNWINNKFHKLVLIMDPRPPSQPSPPCIYLCFQQVTSNRWCKVHQLNCPWLEVKFPDFSLILKKFYFSWPFPDLWQPMISVLRFANECTRKLQLSNLVPRFLLVSLLPVSRSERENLDLPTSRAQIFSRARSASGRFFMFPALKASERAIGSRWGQLPEPETKSERLWEYLVRTLRTRLS